MDVIRDTNIEKLVGNPSLGAVIYQARVLIRELERINDEEYPLQACRIRDVFLCWAEYILEKLWELHDPDDPLGVRGTNGFSRMLALGRAVHKLYSYIQYLLASSPQQSPPAVQLALTQLTDLYFPKLEIGEPICLINPQWTYNLEYLPLTLYLRGLIAPSVLDPDGKLGINNPDRIFPFLWERRFKKLSPEEQKRMDKEPPKQLAVLSFAGLDTHDTLLYPLLAHELGHFIDYSYDPYLHLQDPLPKSAEIREEQVQDILEKASGAEIEPVKVKEVWNILVRQTAVCLRELLADLFATRMLGFAFFAAQSEFLKTLATWPQPTILQSGYPTGYPGIKFRLSVIFKHLTATDYPGNILRFFEDSLDIAPEETSLLIKYLEAWEQRLNETPEDFFINSKELDNTSVLQQQLIGLSEAAVQNTLNNLNEVARRIIPDDKCALLTPRFFKRISQLKQKLPPFYADDEPNCFAEIMSASWAYQLLYGEQREILEKDIERKFSEYNKTCQLVLKAIELIPTLKKVAQSEIEREPEQRKIVSDNDKEQLDKHGVLSAPYIFHRLELPPDHPSHLAVIPLDPKAVQGASLDVRLGNWFVVTRRTRLKSINPGKKSDEQLFMTLGREEIFVPTDNSFLIHPGDFVLGCTLEFIALPDDLMAFVEGRSGPGRMGLIVATATQVAPGFHGVVVLELANTGTVPLEVVPGMPIAQLVFQVMTERVPKSHLYDNRRKYYCQIKP
jgi:dCTP deaminase